jgi:arginase
VTKNCVLVGAPMDSGQKTAGCLMGPAAFRSAGFAAMLTELGHRVSDWGDVKPHAFAEEPATKRRVHAESETVAWTTALAETSRKAMAAGFPIFLGGDHAMAMGTVAGIAAHAKACGRPLFVLWLDAHSDIHTPTTSGSGNYHGMPVAYFVGLSGFDAFPPFPAPIPASNICLFGIRSVDAAEQAALKGRDSGRFVPR